MVVVDVLTCRDVTQQRWNILHWADSRKWASFTSV